MEFKNPFKKLFYTPSLSEPTKSKSLLTKVVEKTDYRIRESIKTWRDNLNYAEHVSRNPIYRTYKDVLLDSHLGGIIELKKDKITSTPFKITVAGETNPEANQMFNSKWFFSFMDTAIDSMFWGHSLLQVDLQPNKINTELIPRDHIIPEEHMFFPNKTEMRDDSKGIDYLQPAYYNYLLEIIIEDRNNLGLLKQLTPLVLWKKSALQNWAEFGERFGLPLQIARTESVRPENKEEIAQWLQEMGAAGYGVFDKQTELEFVQTSSTDAYNIFEKLIELLNKEMSKLVLGASMVVDDGASYSQSQVHQNQTDIKTASDLKMIEFLVNDQLIPKFQAIGLLPIDTIFKFDNTEKLSMKDKMAIDNQLLSQGYRLSEDYLRETYGYDGDEIIDNGPASFQMPIENNEEE